MDYAKIDFAAMLGRTDKKGHWLDIEEKPATQDESEELPTEKPEDNNMYMFEGVDYRSTAQKVDVDLFDRLILQESHSASATTSSSERRPSERPTRRPMTDEEKSARTAKMLETKARRKQEMVGVHYVTRRSAKFTLHFQEEAEQQREQRRKARLQQLWTVNNYRSCRISLSDDEDGAAEEAALSETEGRREWTFRQPVTTAHFSLLEETSGGTTLHYVFGDVMKPQVHGEKNVISVHCVGKNVMFWHWSL